MTLVGLGQLGGLMITNTVKLMKWTDHELVSWPENCCEVGENHFASAEEKLGPVVSG